MQPLKTITTQNIRDVIAWIRRQFTWLTSRREEALADATEIERERGILLTTLRTLRNASLSRDAARRAAKALRTLARSEAGTLSSQLDWSASWIEIQHGLA